MTANLDYDKQIWIVFSVGIFFSIGVLFYFYSGNLSNWNIIALCLGFAFFVYSAFAILGYNFKKERLREIIHKFSFLDKRYLLERELSLKLDKSYYLRVKWIAEIILLGGLFVYFHAFSRIGIFYVLIPVLILCFFTLIHLWSNKKVLKDNFSFS